MSYEIDNKVVSMEFDNSKFDSRVKDSMETIGDLKESLKFDKVAEDVKVRFNAIQVMATTALANITNSIVNTVRAYTQSMGAVANVSAGFRQFADETVAIRTLQAQGYEMEKIAETVDKLRWFTDETSYSFIDMINNMGKFTAAGVDLSTAMKAMEGISLWASLSGQGSTQASNLMYQMSQMIPRGYMTIQDYASVRNANMDTKEFREVIQETAIAMGTLKKNADGTFRVMSNGKLRKEGELWTEMSHDMWFTSDVFLKAMDKYTTSVDQIYNKQIEGDYDNATQAMEALGDELDEFGHKAFLAGQEARTFQDVIVSVQKAMSSQWSRIFRAIWGDADQTVTIWTAMANKLWDKFAGPLSNVADIFERWSVSKYGTKALWSSINGIVEGLIKIKSSLKEGYDGEDVENTPYVMFLFNMVKKLKEFSEEFEKALTPYKIARFRKIGAGFGAVIDIIKMSVLAFIDGIKELIDYFNGGATGKSFWAYLLDGAASVGDVVVRFRDWLETNEIFQKGMHFVVSSIISAVEWIKNLKSSISDFMETPAVQSIIGWFRDIGSSVWNALQVAFKNIGGVISEVWKHAKNVWEWIVGIFNRLKEAVVVLWNDIVKPAVDKIVDAIKGMFDQRSLDSINQQNGKALWGLSGWLKAILALLLTLKGFLAIKDLSSFIKKDLFGFFKSLSKGVGEVKTFFYKLFKEVPYIAEQVNTFLSTKIFDNIGKLLLRIAAAMWIIASIPAKDLGRAVMVTGLIIGALTAIMYNLLRSKGSNGQSFSLGTVLATFKNDSKQLTGLSSLSAFIIAFSTACLMIAGAITMLSALKPSKILTGGLVMVAVIAALGIVMHAITKNGSFGSGGSVYKEAGKFAATRSGSGILGAAALILAFATACLEVAVAIAALSFIPPAKLVAGTAVMMAVITALTVAMRVIAKGTSGLKLISSAASVITMISMVGSVVVLAGLVAAIGFIPAENLTRGVNAITRILLALTIAAALLQSPIGVSASRNATAMVKMVLAIGLMVPVISALANIPADKFAIGMKRVAQGIAVLVPGLILLGGVMALIRPAAGVILKLSIAMNLLTIPILGAAAAIWIITKAFTALTNASAGIADAIGKVLSGLIVALDRITDSMGGLIITIGKRIIDIGLSLIPYFLESLIDSMTRVLALVPVVVDALIKLISEIFKALTNRVPELVESIGGFVKAIYDEIFKAFGQALSGQAIKGMLMIATSLLELAAAALLITKLNVKGAAMGVAAFGIIIAGIAGIVATLGAISKIDGAQRFMQSGAKMLGTIGSAIGDFFGSLTGAFGNGIAKNLPAIGESLNDFYTKIKPFMEGIGSLKEGSSDTLYTLAKTLFYLADASLAFTVANINGNAVTNLTNLISQLTPFAEAVSKFSAIANKTDIDFNKFDQLATAAQKVGNVYRNLPSLSGIKGLWSGSNNMGNLTEQLMPFVEAILSVSREVSATTINLQSISTACEAGILIGDMVKQLPSSGIKGWFEGVKKLDNFSSQLEGFGKAIVAFDKQVSAKALNLQAITNAVDASKIIASLYDVLPDIVGIHTRFIDFDSNGGSLKDFGKDLKAYGKSLKDFGSSVSAITENDVTQAKLATEMGAALAGLYPYLENNAGLFTIFSSYKDLGAFGKGIAEYGHALNEFCSIDLPPKSKCTNACDVGTIFAEFLVTLPANAGFKPFFEGIQSLSSFGKQLKGFGEGISDFSTSIEGTTFSKDKAQSAVDVAAVVASLYEVLPDLTGVITYLSGAQDLGKFGKDLPTFGTGISKFIESISGTSFDASQALGFSRYCAGLGELANGLASLTYAAANMSQNEIWANFATNLPSLGEGIVAFQNSIGNTTFDSGNIGAAASAISTLFASMKEANNFSTFIENLSGVSKTSVETFVSNVGPLGAGIAAFSDAIAGEGSTFDGSKVKKASEAIVNIAKAMDQMSGIDNFWDFVYNVNDLGISKSMTVDDFGNLGRAIASFATNAATGDYSTIEQATSALTNLASSMVTVNGINAESLALFATYIGDIGSKMKLFADYMNSANWDSVEDNFNKCMNMFSSMSDGSGSVSGMTEAWGDVGKSIGNAIVNGARDGFADNGAAEAIASYAAPTDSAISSLKSQWTNFGYNVVRGFANGISMNSWIATQAARNMAVNATNAAKKALDEHSPSKVFDKIGAYVAMGFANGVEREGDLAVNAVKTVANSTVAAFNDAVQIMDKSMGDGAGQPVITPVLNLSSVYDSLKDMNSKMANDPSLGVVAKIGADVNANLQGQNNFNSDLFNAIDALGSVLAQPNNTYNINGVTYDDGSNIADAVGTIIAAARVERRA